MLKVTRTGADLASRMKRSGAVLAKGRAEGQVWGQQSGFSVWKSEVKL